MEKKKRRERRNGMHEGNHHGYLASTICPDMRLGAIGSLEKIFPKGPFPCGDVAR